MLRLLLLVLLSGCGLVAADPGVVPDDLPEALRRSQAAAVSIPALRLPFTQIKHLAILDEPLVTPGCLEIDRVAWNLRWEFTGQAVLILSQGRLRRWGPDGKEENLRNDPAGQALGKQLQALLTGDWAPLRTLFSIADGPDGTVLFTPLTPEIARFIARLTLSFAASGAPTQMNIETAGGDRTEYKFSPPDPNWRPDPARFSGP